MVTSGFDEADPSVCGACLRHSSADFRACMTICNVTDCVLSWRLLSCFASRLIVDDTARYLVDSVRLISHVRAGRIHDMPTRQQTTYQHIAHSLLPCTLVLEQLRKHEQCATE